jgi:signal transduction histidine kinase
LEDRKQQFWIGSPIGLISWRGQVLARYSTNNGLSDNDVLGILQAPDDALWIGTGKGGINRFHQGRFQSFRMQGGLLADSAVPLLVEPNGTVWIGTSRGLNRIQGNQIRAITPREGLFTGQAYSLLDDQRGSLWASGDQGFWRLKKLDLDAVVEGRTNWLQCLHYGAGDGVLSSEANGDRQPSACRTADGYLWFPTRRGVAVVDPSKLVGDDVAPSVVLEQIVVADRDVIWGDGMGVEAARTDSVNPSGKARAKPARLDATPPPVRLEAGQGRVIEIHYSANSFTAPERIRFKFILEGHDRNWTLDENNRRMVYYPDLRPGSYKFRVTACNSHQFWNAEEASFAFTIAPHFYETWAFYFTCGLAVIAFAAGIQSYRLRLQRRILVLEQQTALERERARIAQDIHDDLGSRLSQLSILGELAERHLEGPNPARGHILKMMNTSKDMFQAMDEIVWAVNPKLDSLAGLASYPNYPLSAEARHHLFLVVKEALRNTVQHARATEVWLRLMVSHQTLELTIEDNGVGFRVDARCPEVAQSAHVGPGSSRPTPDPNGNGLKNMRSRMEEMGGSLVIEAHPGKGTTLRLLLPLPDRERV